VFARKSAEAAEYSICCVHGVQRVRKLLKLRMLARAWCDRGERNAKQTGQMEKYDAN